MSEGWERNERSSVLDVIAGRGCGTCDKPSKLLPSQLRMLSDGDK